MCRNVELLWDRCRGRGTAKDSPGWSSATFAIVGDGTEGDAFDDDEDGSTTFLPFSAFAGAVIASSTTLGDAGVVAGSEMGEGGTSTIEIGVLAKTGCGADTTGVGAGAGAPTAFAAMLGSA